MTAETTDFQERFERQPARYPEMRGRVALVTGGGRTIGQGIVLRLAREGMRVVVAGLDEGEVKATVEGLQTCGVDALAASGDLSQPDAINDLFERVHATYGTLDLLVNNAADLRRVRIERLTEEMIDTQLNVNIRVPLMCSLKALEIMRPLHQGSIVNISSVGGSRSHLPGLPYDLTKAALEMMTRNIAVEVAADGVRVNGVAPGWIPPKRESDVLDASGRRPTPLLPMRHGGTSSDIAAAVAFLASDDAAYITGHTLVVDGGLLAQLHPPEHPI